MKISVNKKEFVSAMADVIKVIPQKPIIPITGYGLMKLTPSDIPNELGNMIIAGTDMEHMIFKSLSAIIEGEAKDIVFDIRKMYNLCKKISGMVILFDIDSTKITITSLTGKYEILFVEKDATLFPVLTFQKEEQESAKILTMDRRTFVDIITRASKYTDIKELALSPALHCIYMVFGINETVAYATDNRILSQITLPITNKEEVEIMINYNTIKFLPFLDDEEITIVYTQGIYSLISGSVKIIARSTNSSYPNIIGLIQGLMKNAETFVSFNFSKEMFLDSMDRLKTLAEENYAIVKIELHKAEIKISLYQTNTNTTGEEVHECIVNSDNKITIMLSVDYLIMILNSFENDELTFMIKDMTTQVDKALCVKQTNEKYNMTSLLFPTCYT